MADKFKACSVIGCNRNAHCRAGGRKGYCNAHRKRIVRHGDPLAGGTMRGDPLRWVNEVALQYIGHDCLAWPFSLDGNGYGQVWVNGKLVVASRYICTLVNGDPVTPEHDAAHSCGNGHMACVNPHHLLWKTKSENCADKLAHDTHNRGERCGSAKLTEADVKQIISMKGRCLQRETAVMFGISPSTVSAIQSRKSWVWLR